MFRRERERERRERERDRERKKERGVEEINRTCRLVDGDNERKKKRERQAHPFPLFLFDKPFSKSDFRRRRRTRWSGSSGRSIEAIER